jgi:phosphopantothenoylcysteine decarboxylase/phosphopantothenate--cysteine ligase
MRPTHFITPVTMQALSGKPVYSSQWDPRVANNMAHIDVTRDADAIIIAPCSADFMRKLAHGACDDLLSTMCLARPRLRAAAGGAGNECRDVAEPCHPAQRAQLRDDGIAILGPAAGDQACGEVGLGRMLEPAQLLEELIASFQPKVLAGKRVLITAGPTFEAIDPVRGITNLSSGKMGYAVARAAREAGAEVVLVSGPTALETPFGVTRINVQSAQQMHDAVMAAMSTASTSSSPWRRWPTGASPTPATRKLKKTAGRRRAAAEVRAEPGHPGHGGRPHLAGRPPYCVGFAAESENLIEYGAAKREKKASPCW